MASYLDPYCPNEPTERPASKLQSYDDRARATAILLALVIESISHCKTTQLSVETFQGNPPRVSTGSSLPIFLVTVFAAPRLLWTARCLAGNAGSCTDNVIARLTVGLRFLVVRLARLWGFGRDLNSGRLDRGRGLSRSGSIDSDSGSGLIIGFLVPRDFFFGRRSYWKHQSK